MDTLQRYRVVIALSSFPAHDITPLAAFTTGRKYTAAARYMSAYTSDWANSEGVLLGRQVCSTGAQSTSVSLLLAKK
jgi:hypothetical protein